MTEGKVRGLIELADAELDAVAGGAASFPRFDQHKNHPIQVPIGTPIALEFIAAALLLLPQILGPLPASRS
jgi:intracellular multiplication protein IcmD